MKKNVIIGLDPIGSGGKCDYCGKIADTRPYGINGANVCFECGMKPENKKQTEKAFDDILSGESEMPTPEQKN